MTWVLIIFVGIGAMADREANAMVAVPGFKAQGDCVAAGEAAKSAFSTGTKSARYVCVRQ